MKKVSVIIPTYSRADSLERAIKSVLNQTYKNIEIIVVDDNDKNSYFRTINEKNLKKYENLKNFIYMKHEINKNGAAARNTGLKVATGDYIAFLDDDDYYIENRIEVLVKFLEENKDLDAVYTAVAIKKQNKVIDMVHYEKIGNLQYDLLNQKSFFGTGSNIFIRKNIVEKIGFFDEEFKRHQDIEYMIRFFEISKIGYINQLLVIKCIEKQRNTLDYLKLKEVKNIFLKKFTNIISKYSEEEVKNIYYNNYKELLYVTYNSREHYKECIDYLKKYNKNLTKLKLKYSIKKFLYKTKIVNNIVELLFSYKYRCINRKLIEYEKLLNKM